MEKVNRCMKCLEPIPEDRLVCSKKSCQRAFRSFNIAMKEARRKNKQDRGEINEGEKAA